MAVRGVLVTDGKRGHENQGRVAATMVGDGTPLVMKMRDSVKEGGPAEWMLRMRLRYAGQRRMSSEAASQIVRKYLEPADAREFREFAKDVSEGRIERVVVGSAGTPPATFNLVVSAMLRATSVVVMTPSLLPRSLFGLNIIPAHDWHGGDPPTNVIIATLSLAHLDKAEAERLMAKLRRENDLPESDVYWGLALGGPSRSGPWHEDYLQKQFEAIFEAARRTGIRLLVTTSRRTPPWCAPWFQARKDEGAPIAYFLDAAKDPLNPLHAFYLMSHRMLVTADSFSMVSEAANAGFRVDLITTSSVTRTGKLGMSLGRLIELGIATEFQPETATAGTENQDTRPWEFNWHYNELRKAVRFKLGL